MSDMNTLTWFSERWYGEPKYRSTRYTNAKVDLGFTIQEDVKGDVFLQIRSVRPGKKNADWEVGIFKCLNETMSSAKKAIKKAWVTMQNSSEDEMKSFNTFWDTLVSYGWLPAMEMPCHHGMMSVCFCGRKAIASWATTRSTIHHTTLKTVLEVEEENKLEPLIFAWPE